MKVSQMNKKQQQYLDRLNDYTLAAAAGELDDDMEEEMLAELDAIWYGMSCREQDEISFQVVYGY